MTIDALLSEKTEDARRREHSTFEDLAAQSGGKFVLFGAGRLGRKALATLRAAGLEPLAFCDNDERLQGAKVEGVDVFSPANAAARWGESALFVITIFRPTGDAGLGSRVAFLGRLGCRRVTTFLELGWRFPGIIPHFGADRPSTFLAEAKDLRRMYYLWHDDVSRDTCLRQLRWRLWADFCDSPTPASDQYFCRDLVRARPDEVFIDGGAFDGDTIRRLPWPFQRAWAIEPDPGSATRLRLGGNPNITVCEMSLGRESGQARFNAEGTWASARSELGSVIVTVTPLDALLANERPTFIKLDVEGDELDALEGARSVLAKAQPVVAVCLYHRPEHFWKIPLFLRETLPDHRLHLRVHENDGFELVAYAVPPDRWA